MPNVTFWPLISAGESASAIGDKFDQIAYSHKPEQQIDLKRAHWPVK
jgi:hypothetical protein